MSKWTGLKGHFLWDRQIYCFTGMYVGTFQSGIFTGWGNEAVKHNYATPCFNLLCNLAYPLLFIFRLIQFTPVAVCRRVNSPGEAVSRKGCSRDQVHITCLQIGPSFGLVWFPWLLPSLLSICRTCFQKMWMLKVKSIVGQNAHMLKHEGSHTHTHTHTHTQRARANACTHARTHSTAFRAKWRE